jgi:hypothetical protein
MAVPHHDDLEFVAGDDWDIGGTLIRRDGTPYDLTSASVLWMLRGPDGLPALSAQQYTVSLSTPLTAGLLTVVVASDITANLPPGRYTDWLRATDSAGTDTFWTGIILVDANPFGD